MSSNDFLFFINQCYNMKIIKKRKNQSSWKPHETEKLLLYVIKNGVGNWISANIQGYTHIHCRNRFYSLVRHNNREAWALIDILAHKHNLNIHPSLFPYRK